MGAHVTMASLEERLLSKVVKDAESGCWVWVGYRNPLGYGRIGVGGKHGKVAYVHRVSYELYVGPIPDGLVLDHYACDNPSCVNPEHLRPVTQRENTLRSNTSKAATNCAKETCHLGHHAWKFQADGCRFCGECHRLASYAWKQREKAKRRSASKP
jgi:hypothetical protein